MKNSGKILLVAAVWLCSTVSAFSQSSAATRPIQANERAALFASRSLIDQGRAVAESACTDCHGENGVSSTPGTPHLAGQRMVYLYRVLQAYQARQRRHDAMNQAAGFLNDDALLAVSAYYATLAPARPVANDEAVMESAGMGSGDPFAGIRESMKKCVRCHGEDGNSTASGMPNLSAQDPEYFVTSMKAYVDGSRDHKMMKRLVAKLDDATLDAMGVFYAVQDPARTETTGEGNPDLGRALSEPCASCHGEDGNAPGADMPTLAGQDARYFIKAMQAYRDGTRSHQAMFDAVEPLGESEVADLATFYAGQEPVRRNVRKPLTSAEWIERCERCHGIDGNSTDPRFPMLAAQDRTYLTNALQSYIGSTRSNSTMHAMSDPLSEGDIGKIVEFYAEKEPKSVVYIQLPCEDGANQ